MAKETKPSRLNPRNDLTADYVRSILRYCKKTGEFTWAAHRKFAGKSAGSVDRRGYLKVVIDNKSYTGGRLAWLYVTGEWPSGHIDHKNLIRSDNRWINIRNASIAQNGWNSRARIDCKSGAKGVHFHPVNKNWVARIRLDGRMKHIGSYRTKGEAKSAYDKYAKRIRGEFFRG